MIQKTFTDFHATTKVFCYCNNIIAPWVPNLQYTYNGIIILHIIRKEVGICPPPGNCLQGHILFESRN